MIQDNTNYFNMNDFVGKNADVNTIDKFDFHSFYRAYVVDNQDNEKLGRVKIRIPALHENSTTYPWAYPATLTGFGFQTGMFILPPIGSLVWVTFEYSDEHRPIYFGGIPTTYADGKYQSYGPYINGNNPVKVTGNDIPFEYTGSQQIIYKSPKGSILYFDNGEINDLIVMKNVYGQGMEVGAIYDNDTGDYDRYTKMIYDDDNYVQINEGEFHLVLDGEDITLEPSTFNSYNELTNKPQINNVTLQGNKSWQDLGLPSIPTKVSDLENDTGFITKTVNNLTNYYLKTDTYTKTEVNNLIAQINSFNVAIVQVLPTTNIDTHTIYLVPKEGSTQDIYNEYLYVNNNWELLGTTEIDLTNYYTKTEVNTLLASKADISDVPPKMSILSYGHSTWNDFITAYNSKSIVYCRASSNSNPATGSQTRLAFMAYVNNAENPTEVEFQYYRSVSSHTITQQGDQVFVYKLNKTNGWSVLTRQTMANIDASDGLTRSYSGNKLTISGAGKQDLLVSGTNIKTINNESILGSGNISISGGGDPTGIININDYTDNIVIATDLKKGTYVILNSLNFGQTSMKIKYTSSNTSYLTFSDVDSGLIYVLEDIEEGMADGTPIIYYDTLTTGGAASRHTVVLDSNNPHGLRGMSNAGSTRTIILSGGAQSIYGVKTFTVLPESSVTPTSSNQLVNKQYVDDSILNSGLGLFILDPADYPHNNLSLMGLKKGIYMWKDGYSVFNLKLTDSNSQYLTFNIMDRLIYVLQDITSSLPDNTPIVAIPQYRPNNTSVKSVVLTVYNGADSGLTNSYDMQIPFVNTTDNQTISGVKTFNSLPLCSVVPTGSTQLVNKQYVDDCIANSITNVLGGSI